MRVCVSVGVQEYACASVSALIDAIEKTCIFYSAYLLAYQVLSNHNEPQAIWFDNSELKSLPEAEDSDDVILIDDDDDDGNGNGNDSCGGDFETSNSLTHEPSDTNSSSGEQKLYTCDICTAKLSSSYNLKRHHMSKFPFVLFDLFCVCIESH